MEKSSDVEKKKAMKAVSFTFKCICVINGS
jgi:hypothetical protein